MSATALPSNGNNPQNRQVAGKTCDARGLVEIHRMFRKEFGNAPALVDRVVDSDFAQAEIVGDHLAMLSTSLHAHHEGEESLLWDQLEGRVPACGVHVTRMKKQHATLLEHLHELDAALPAWRASGSQADAVTASLAGINAALAVHLPDEELSLVPVIETVITAAEVDALSAHGRRSTPKGKTFVQLGAILEAQPDGGASWQRAHLPPPARLIWRLVGRSRYEKYRATLVK